MHQELQHSTVHRSRFSSVHRHQKPIPSDAQDCDWIALLIAPITLEKWSCLGRRFTGVLFFQFSSTWPVVQFQRSFVARITASTFQLPGTTEARQVWIFYYLAAGWKSRSRDPVEMDDERELKRQRRGLKVN